MDDLRAAVPANLHLAGNRIFGIVRECVCDVNG